MEQILTQVVSGNIGTMVIILILWRTGFLKELLKNGKNGNGEVAELKEQIATLQDNHLHTLGEKMDRFIESMASHNAKEIVILEDIKESLKK